MLNSKILDQLKTCLQNKQKITFLVGAGLSAESGIPTFRGKDGYWVSGSKNYRAEEMATYQMFSQSAKEVWKWYLYRKSVTDKAKPNQSHYLLKEIEDQLQDQFCLISQNVDGLHRRAGSSLERSYLIHGDFDYVRCGNDCTSELFPFPKEIDLKNRNNDIITEAEWNALTCPKCGQKLRPHVLWFDEQYNEEYFKIDTVLHHSSQTGLLFLIGTSGATTLPQLVAQSVVANNGMIVEINIEDSYFSEALRNHEKGQIVRQKSSPFLSALKDEINNLLTS